MLVSDCVTACVTRIIVVSDFKKFVAMPCKNKILITKDTSGSRGITLG